MKKNLNLLLFILLSSFSTSVIAQTFEAYYQQNHRWNGKAFIEDNVSLTSTRFIFNKNQLQIDNSRFTITNRIDNSTGEYLTAVANDGSKIKISVSLTTKKESNGKVFKCLTVERAASYKIVYYLK